MPRTPEDRSRDISLKYTADPEYALTLSQKARERWNREHRAEITAMLAEFEDGRLQRQMLIGLHTAQRTVDDGQPLDEIQKTLLRAVRDIQKGSAMYNAVEPSQVHHEVMTGEHEHEHAAHGARDSDDGIHFHRHQHHNDNRHDTSLHAEDHGHGFGPGHEPGKASGTGEAVSGMYGRQLSGNIGPAERRRLRDAQLAEHEARGGSA